MSKTMKIKMAKYIIILFIGLFLLLLYLVLIKPNQDQTKIAKMICNDKNLIYINRDQRTIDTSNVSYESYYTQFSKVNCSGQIFNYEPNIYTSYSDCSTRDKWGYCKNSLWASIFGKTTYSYTLK